MSKKINILLTGCSGFIGQSFANKYCDIFDIYSISKTRSSNIPGIKKEFIFDLSDIKNYDVLNVLNIDVILHFAGQSSELKSFEDPLNDFQGNTQSTVNLLEYARKNHVKQFIYSSSSCVYKIEDHKESYSETDIVPSNTFYSNSKIASENFIKCYGKYFNINYTIFRYFSIYGPGQDISTGIMNAFIKQFLDDNVKNIEVKGSLDRFRDFIYIDDAINITKSCVLNRKYFNKVINVGTGKKTTLTHLLSTLKKLFNSSKDFYETEGTKGNQFGLYADTTLLRTLYLEEFTPFQNGLANYLNDLKNK